MQTISTTAPQTLDALKRQAVIAIEHRLCDIQFIIDDPETNEDTLYEVTEEESDLEDELDRLLRNPTPDREQLLAYIN